MANQIVPRELPSPHEVLAMGFGALGTLVPFGWNLQVMAGAFVTERAGPECCVPTTVSYLLLAGGGYLLFADGQPMELDS